jgi:hypothetical protein
VIGQRRERLTAKQEKQAYAACTERDKGRCTRCGTNAPTHRDHRQNRDAYNTTPANLQLLCALVCHPWKTANPEAAMREGFSVSRFVTDPATAPAFRFGVGWVLYFDAPDVDGNWWRPAADPNS